MRFLLDESADVRLKSFGVGQGHDVTSVVPDHAAGLPDTEVLAIAHREQRILITGDRDFGELIFRRGQAHSGVILYRLDPTDLTTRLAWLERVLRDHAEQLDRFLVITRTGIRVRAG